MCIATNVHFQELYAAASMTSLTHLHCVCFLHKINNVMYSITNRIKLPFIKGIWFKDILNKWSVLIIPRKKTRRLHVIHLVACDQYTRNYRWSYTEQTSQWPKSSFYKRNDHWEYSAVRRIDLSYCNRECCRITSSVSNWNVVWNIKESAFIFQNNISRPRMLFCNIHENSSLIY